MTLMYSNETGLVTLLFKVMGLALWHYCTKRCDWPCDIIVQGDETGLVTMYRWDWSYDIIVQSDETGLVTLMFKVMRLTLWHYCTKWWDWPCDIVQSDVTGLVTLLYRLDWSCDIIVQSDGTDLVTLLYKVMRLALWHCTKWCDWPCDIIVEIRLVLWHYCIDETGLVTLLYKVMWQVLWHYCTKWWDWSCDITVQSDETGLVTLYKVMWLALWHYCRD